MGFGCHKIFSGKNYGSFAKEIHGNNRIVLEEEGFTQTKIMWVANLVNLIFTIIRTVINSTVMCFIPLPTRIYPYPIQPNPTYSLQCYIHLRKRYFCSGLWSTRGTVCSSQGPRVVLSGGWGWWLSSLSYSLPPSSTLASKPIRGGLRPCKMFRCIRTHCQKVPYNQERAKIQWPFCGPQKAVSWVNIVLSEWTF